MSTRTLIEINHDLLHRLQDDPSIMARILDDLGCTRYNAELNRANEEGKPLQLASGVTLVLQRHHSEYITVKTRYVKVRL
ncbi:hypothetical protein [Paraburkholderia kururiensis]|uniref:hypothetical protein n=1 Tax=Paraburkholderia kururiensis TaxID=984307 RepID=UPI0005A9CBEC|nr:hypothetical protein [Paraburkholderia kururiensis]